MPTLGQQNVLLIAPIESAHHELIFLDIFIVIRLVGILKLNKNGEIIILASAYLAGLMYLRVGEIFEYIRS